MYLLLAIDDVMTFIKFNKFTNPVYYFHPFITNSHRMIQFINYYIYFCILIYNLKINQHNHLQLLDQLLSSLVLNGDNIKITETILNVNYTSFTSVKVCHTSQVKIKSYQISNNFSLQWFKMTKRANYGRGSRHRYHDYYYTIRKMIKLISLDIEDRRLYKELKVQEFSLQYKPKVIMYQDEVYYATGQWYYDNGQKIIII